MNTCTRILSKVIPGLMVMAMAASGSAVAGVPEGYMLTDRPPVQGHAAQGMSGRQTWELNKYQDYAYTLEQTCFCVLPKRARVYVLGGRVIQVDDLESGKIHTQPEMLGVFRTINGYFKLIDSLVSQQPDAMTLRLNRYYGYPEIIKVDLSYRMADEEIDYRIGDFKFMQKK